MPSGGAVGTARAIAHAYSVFATGGRELGLRKKTLFSLGFMKSSAVWPFGSKSSFGSPGSGGSLGFADPEAGIGYAYVTSQMGTRLTGDLRDVALRDALYSAIPSRPTAVGRLVA